MVPLQTKTACETCYLIVSHCSLVEPPSMNFSGRHYPKDLILQTVRWYLSYNLSYRDLKEILEERGVKINHTTPYRWVQEYVPFGKILLLLLLSIACNLQANSFGVLQNITIGLDDKYNEQALFFSWENLAKVNSENAIFFCVQNKKNVVFRKPVDLSNTRMTVLFSSFIKNKDYLVNSLICNLRIKSELIGDIDIKGEELISSFQAKKVHANNQYVSWEMPPNLNPVNIIINLSSTDFDEDSVILPGNHNIWYYEYPLEPGEYMISIEINVNNGYRYKSTTYELSISERTNKNGFLISLKQTNITEEHDQDNENNYEYIIPSALAGAVNLGYFIGGLIVPFICYTDVIYSTRKAQFHAALIMNLSLLYIDLPVLILGPGFAYLFI